MEIEYRAYDNERDYAGQRELFRLCFPETRGTTEESGTHYQWKFDEFPAVTPSYQYVGCDGDKVVGYYAALPYRYMIDGVIHTSGMVCDVMTHPELRGKGIFTKIGRYSLTAMQSEGMDFTMGYPVRAEVIPGHLKVGWKIVQEMPVYVRPVGVRNFIPSILSPLVPLANFVLSALQAWTRINPSGYTSETLTREVFLSEFSESTEFTDLISIWTAEQSNALIKDLAFLRWRTAAPGRQYHFLLLRFEGRLVGVAIARATRLRSIETLAVLDFMVERNHLAGCRALHSGLMRLAKDEKADLVACMTSVRWAKTYHFAGSCYVRTSAVFSLITKKLRSELTDESVYSDIRWHVFWIDSDDL